MWNIIPHISSGLSLAAFLAALILIGHRATLNNRLKIIRTVPRQQRADVITKELNTFGINASSLNKTQQFHLAVKELTLRSRREFRNFIISIAAMVVFATISIVSIISGRHDAASLSNIEISLNNIQKLLENKDTHPQQLAAFIDQRGLELKYPLGFALFYSDGRKLLYYGRSNNSEIVFDPTSLRVTRQGQFYCMSILPVRIYGNILDNIKNLCVANMNHAALIYGVYVDIEPLATSTEGAAWVVGMKSAT